MTRIDLSEALEQIENVNQILLAFVFIIGGCLITFWGSKLFKPMIFLIGFVAGTLFTYWIINTIDIHTSLRIHLLVSCGIGVFVGFICVMVYKMTVFTTGAIAGLIVGQFLWQFVVTNFPDSFMMEHYELCNTILIIVISLLFGFMAFKFMNIAIRGLTAFVGSFMVSSGIAFFVAKYIVEDDANVMNMIKYFEANDDMESLERECHTECYASLGVWSALFLSGLLYQYQCLHKCRKNKEREIVSDNEEKQVIIQHNHYHQGKHGSNDYIQMYR